MKKSLALLLLALAPALAQDAKDADAPKPARDAKTVALAPLPIERALARVETLARDLPATRKLFPPRKGTMKLAILLVELADCPRPAWGKQAWQEMLFSKESYTRDADGQPAFGSVHDYYREQSGGQLDLEGKVFDWVSIPVKRSELERSQWFSIAAKRSLLNAAVDRLLAREGAGALDAYDALGFIVSGPSAEKYGTVLWPHSDAFVHGSRVWRYYLMHAGTQRFESIGVHAHEIGHVLGLPDEYGVGHHAGSGIYCLMAIGNAGGWDDWVNASAPPVAPRDAFLDFARGQLHELVDRLFKRGAAPLPLRNESGTELFCLQLAAPPATAARPLHICAPCKAALGWVKPIGVAKGQRLFLEPVEDHPADVIALPLAGTERLVLEYRGRRGFDAGLPRSGLLAWRTGSLFRTTLDTLAPGANGELVPAHGVKSVDAAHREGVLWPAGEHATIEVGGARVSHVQEKDGRLYLEVER